MPNWTDEMIDRLRVLWAEKWPASAIGAELNLSRNAIIGRAHRMGLERRKSTPTRSTWQKQSTGRKPRMKDDTDPIVPLPEPEPAPLESSDHRCGILQLTDKSCRWLSDGWYCGKPEADLLRGRPYCAHHTKRAWTAGKPPREHVNYSVRGR